MSNRLRHGWRWALAIALVPGGCTHPSTLSQPLGSSRAENNRLVAQAWVTTGDQARIFARESDIGISTGTDTTSVVITVDASTAYQTMIGFGAAMTDASAYLIETKLSAAQRDALLQDLFGHDPGIRLSFLRVPMGASDFSLRHYSYDDLGPNQTDATLARFSIAPDSQYKIPALKRALAINSQLTLMATPWSPPGWMKTTGSLMKGTLLPQYYDAFANYFVVFLDAYKAAGIPISAITIQNEPHFEPADYPGMRLDDTARATIIGQHVGPLLASRAPNVEILDWDHNWDDPNAPLTVLSNRQAAHYVSGVAWHCYAGDVSAQQTVHEQHADKETWFTECSGGAWSPNWSDNLKWFVGTLMIGSTRDWARGVLLWNLALDENDGPHTGGCGNCRGVVTINSTSGVVTRNVEYFALAHASTFVRPGARRIASTTDVNGMQSVAFQNADDASKALIVLNTATVARGFAVHDGSSWFRYTLPVGSVVTFVWK
jgi:glucosylceramidase